MIYETFVFTWAFLYCVGDAGLYQSNMVLSRALSQYLVLLAKVPASLRIPHDKENDILKFIVMAVEVRTNVANMAVPVSPPLTFDYT